MGHTNHTHDPGLESWVASANDPTTDFPIQNLPFGRFKHGGSQEWRIGVAIGDQVIDLARLSPVRECLVARGRKLGAR